MNLLAVLFVSFLLFALGLAVILVRRQLLFVLMGIEVMTNGAVLAAVAAGQYWHSADGQVLSLFMMLVAGSELAITLLLAMLSYRYLKVSRIDQMNQLQDKLDKEGQLL
ncbi:NADH-quinone oxidoreductase subunit NuoK [Pokkaliibacter sp. MBI-7]|uniref:NADH-quinone oxidoreductase subunit NuoK n=1 Tax=Pokkaliibacter sp. MBI-7 TaxID=3040600 RepID=UPI00244BA8C1|nr:NADH-quinone oxidoreductase subunit NuoK [Pokkaliibacter sp. MBI-7]MDH2433337.1 NADH-quinone oxidoreductase subunit NuoK [Pokkaliibacter sp. MBI-7]